MQKEIRTDDNSTESFIHGFVFWILMLNLLPFLLQSDMGGANWSKEFVMYREFLRNHVHQLGRIPLWNPYVGGGQPVLPDMHLAVFYPFTWISVLLPLEPGLKVSHVLHILIAIVGIQRLCRISGISKFGGNAGTIVFILGGFLPFQQSLGAYGIFASSCWFPLFFSYLEETISRRRRFTWLYTAVCGTLIILSGRPAYPMYALLFSIVYVGVRLVTLRLDVRIVKRTLLQLSFASVCAAILSSACILSIIDYLPLTGRYYELTAFDTSTADWPPWNLAALITPHGMDYLPSALWSFHPARRAALWVGTISFVFILCAFIVRPQDKLRSATTQATRLTHTIMALTGLVLAMGSWSGLSHPLSAIPYWGNLRGASRVLIIPAMSLSFLAALGIDHIKNQARPLPFSLSKRTGRLFSILLIAIGLMIFFKPTIASNHVVKIIHSTFPPSATDRALSKSSTAVAQYFRSRFYNRFVKDRSKREELSRETVVHYRNYRFNYALKMIQLDGANALTKWFGFFVCLTGIVIFVCLTLHAQQRAFVLLIFALLELIFLAYPYTSYHPVASEEHRSWRAGESVIPKTYLGPLHRIHGPPLSLLEGTNRDLYYTETTGPFMSFGQSRWIRDIRHEMHGKPSKETPIAYTVLGVDGILSHKSPGPNWVASDTTRFTYSAHRIPYKFYQNDSASGRFRFARVALTTQDQESAIQLSLDTSLDLFTTVIIENDPSRKAPPTGTSSTSDRNRIQIVKHEPDWLQVDVVSKSDQYLLIADAFNPDWYARVNGQPTKIFRAYGAIMALPVPAGESTITLRFSAKKYKWIAFLASLFGFVLLACWKFDRDPLYSTDK